MEDFKLSVVCTRHNIGQLDEFKAIADTYGAQLRLTRLRPSGRGADVWDELHPLPHQQRELYDWLVANGDQVLTGDSFFHLSAYGEALPGLNLCGAGRVVCLVDPVGDVYACPFAIHDQFLAGNLRKDGGFDTIWKTAPLFLDLRSPQTGGACTQCSAYDSCRGGCMAAKFFTGLPLDGPDPECVKGNSETALAGDRERPGSSQDHSHTGNGQERAGAAHVAADTTGQRLRRESARHHMIDELGRTTWPEIDGRPLLLVPVGSVEQHGPALPLTTDTIIAEAVTREAAARLGAVGRPVLVAPAVAYGASGEHEAFPGTVSVGHDALRSVLVELGRSASRWASDVVFVNGHGGNAPTVASAVDLLRTEGCAASWAACAAPGSDAHAGLTETSLLLHLAPETVRVDLLEPGDTRPVTALMPALRSQGVRAVSANGVLGDPTGASAEEGRRVLGVMVDRVVAEVGG